ncbi:Cadherin-8 [Blastocladiella emersonii ATCC 22665]|nr:Cadherin-8 [Blastocladiella emersonii ATCC 22665]
MSAFADKQCDQYGLPEPATTLFRDAQNRPVCGPQSAANTCLLDQCCSNFGFCGPIANPDGTYTEGGKNVTKAEATAVYCGNKPSGDWRGWTAAGKCSALGGAVFPWTDGVRPPARTGTGTTTGGNGGSTNNNNNNGGSTGSNGGSSTNGNGNGSAGSGIAATGSGASGSGSSAGAGSAGTSPSAGGSVAPSATGSTSGSSTANSSGNRTGSSSSSLIMYLGIAALAAVAVVAAAVFIRRRSRSRGSSRPKTPQPLRPSGAPPSQSGSQLLSSPPPTPTVSTSDAGSSAAANHRFSRYAAEHSLDRIPSPTSSAGAAASSRANKRASRLTTGSSVAADQVVAASTTPASSTTPAASGAYGRFNRYTAELVPPPAAADGYGAVPLASPGLDQHTREISGGPVHRPVYPDLNAGVGYQVASEPQRTEPPFTLAPVAATPPLQFAQLDVLTTTAFEEQRFPSPAEADLDLTAADTHAARPMSAGSLAVPYYAASGPSSPPHSPIALQDVTAAKPRPVSVQGVGKTMRPPVHVVFEYQGAAGPVPAVGFDGSDAMDDGELYLPLATPAVRREA